MIDNYIYIISCACIFIPLAFSQLLKIDKGDENKLKARIRIIIKIQNQKPYQFFLALPLFGILTLIYSYAGKKYSIEWYDMMGIPFLVLIVVYFTYPFLKLAFHMGNRGDVAFSLTKNWDLGTLNRNCASLHIGSNGINRREGLKIIALLKEELITEIEFKSFLLSPDYDKGIKTQNMLRKNMHNHGWIEKPPSKKTTKMNIFTKIALTIKLKSVDRKLVKENKEPLNIDVPQTETQMIFTLNQAANE